LPQKPRFIDPTDAADPPPRAGNYFCIVGDVDIETIKADDAVGTGGNHKVNLLADSNGNVDRKTTRQDLVDSPINEG